MPANPRPINKLLIANRSEVAVRIIRACRALGINSAVVYSDADSSWLPHHLADEAVNIGPGPAASSYLNVDKILAAARQLGADAIHPGYGFFAENAAFARRCAQAGLTFVGPRPETIELMADKAKAKHIVAQLGVPTIPGSHSGGLSNAELAKAAAELRYPVLIKAVAGGGGIGMRIVQREEQFQEALAAVRHEARAAFGEDGVLIERYFESVRHIEVQVIADEFGTVLHCFERECSVQRRRQKILEEAPAIGISDVLRQRLYAASIAIARSAGYIGLGTIEFIVPQAENSQDTFYFLEMNTRLQVEHGVTEAITGLDLVRTQLEIAEGRPLEVTQEQIRVQGHAIQCRVYAEDPLHGFRPAPGQVLRWQLPVASADLRVDTGVTTGTTISPFYDPMIAKIIARGPDRARAIRRVRSALQQLVILGPQTNQRLLATILADTRYIDGVIDTTYVERTLTQLLPSIPESQLDAPLAFAAVALACDETKYLAPGQGGPYRREYALIWQDRSHPVTLEYHNNKQFTLHIAERTHTLEVDTQDSSAGEWAVVIDGIFRRGIAIVTEAQIHVHLSALGAFVFSRPTPKFGDVRAEQANEYVAPMPATVISVLVREGQHVTAGEQLVVLESMKMESSICARADGIVTAILVSEGKPVGAGKSLVKIKHETVISTHFRARVSG